MAANEVLDSDTDHSRCALNTTHCKPFSKTFHNCSTKKLSTFSEGNHASLDRVEAIISGQSQSRFVEIYPAYAMLPRSTRTVTELVLAAR